MLPCVLQLRTPHPCSEGSGAATCSLVLDPASLRGSGSGAATCPMSLDLASMLGRAPKLPHVPRRRTPPPYSRGLWRCHMSHGSRPRLPTLEGSRATTCPMGLGTASLLRRAPVLPRAHSFGPCLPAQEHSVAATCPTALRGPQALRIKKGLAGHLCG
jgi:hypothetical protein